MSTGPRRPCERQWRAWGEGQTGGEQSTVSAGDAQIGKDHKMLAERLKTNINKKLQRLEIPLIACGNVK